MPEQPLVSIIVPIYNAQDHIARCVESIRRQTYRNLEILLLNDGSQDVSLEVCKMYANVDPRIVLIDKANSGVAATRNMGLREARGKYLQFVDADDTIQPYATELLVQRAEESGADLVIAHYNRITPPRPRAEDDPRPEEAGDEEPLVVRQARAVRPERDSRARRREPIICAEDMDWSEDLYFNLSYIRYAEKFYALSTPIYNYFNTPGSAVHTALNPVNIVATRATLFAYYKELYEHLGLYEEYKPQIYKYLVAVAEA